jgi:starvation-inducible DNA-binding protein
MPNTDIIKGLNRLLADATVLYQKLRHYHWNVDGRHFFELHAKFEELYTGWAESIDVIAERVLMLDGVPLHTLRAMLDATLLSEDGAIPAAPGMVEAIETDLRTIHERAGALLETAEAAGDRGTVNMLDGLRDGIEKDLWMLGAWRKEAAKSWT